MAEMDSTRRRGGFKDLTGKQFGKWTVLYEAPRKSGKVYWLCRCECGTKGHVRTSDLRSGKSRSCSVCGKTSTVHGMHGTPEYIVWKRMRARCTNSATAEYGNYGGRGIRVCTRWHEFSLFFADMGPRPSPKHTIDRIDNDGDYSPDNCRWATRKEQNRNSRKNRLLTFNGETRCLAEWAELTGMKPNTLAMRLRRGWSIELTLTALVNH